MCDPSYFLDLEVEENEEEIELHDITEISPVGDWIIDVNDNNFKIIYNGGKYTCIHYNNQEKIITLYVGDIVVKTLKVEIKIVDTSIPLGDIPPPYSRI